MFQTVHDRVITLNTRYNYSYNGFRTWQLSIKDVEESDKGSYMCQLNTPPTISQSGYFEFVDKLKKFLESIFEAIH